MAMTTVERAIALRGVEAFRGVPLDELARVAAVAREERREGGAYLFREGESPGSLFVILDGEVCLERGGVSFARAGAGEPLGTWSLFDDHPRRASARVERETRLLVLDREDFYEALADNVEITRSLVQDLVRRLIEMSGLDDPAAGEER